MGTSGELVVQIQNNAIASRARSWHNFSAVRRFRSQAVLDALKKASEQKLPYLVLHNYPSFSGAFAALFASLPFSCQSPMPCLAFLLRGASKVVNLLGVEDVALEGIQRCYLLDFLGPKNFALQLSQLVSQVMVFDHRKSTLAKNPALELRSDNLVLHIDAEKSSARLAFNYFSSEITKARPAEEVKGLVDLDEAQSLMTVLKYIEDGDLCRSALPDMRAFNIGLRQEWSKHNSLTNPSLFEQLLKLNAANLIAKGKSYMYSRKDAAKKSLGKFFRIQLGKGLYGECLGNLKMCLRSSDDATDTSEISKAYCGGGSPTSSSFIIRMDEYNEWISVNWS